MSTATTEKAKGRQKHWMEEAEDYLLAAGWEPDGAGDRRRWWDPLGQYPEKPAKRTIDEFKNRDGKMQKIEQYGYKHPVPSQHTTAEAARIQSMRDEAAKSERYLESHGWTKNGRGEWVDPNTKRNPPEKRVAFGFYAALSIQENRELAKEAARHPVQETKTA